MILVQAYLGLIVAAIGTAISAYGQVEAGHAAKDANAGRARQQEVQAAQERTKQIREGRIKRAQIQQVAANTGTADSSSAITGASGVTAQTFGNIQFINDQASIGKSISTAQQKEINAQGTAAVGQGIAQVGGSIFSNREELSSVFS